MARLTHSLGSYLQSAAPNFWPKGCPNGYSSHLATVEHSCEINYCVKSHAFSGHGLPPLRRPPFIELPSDAYIDMGTVYNFEISQDGDTWTEITGSETDKMPEKSESYSGTDTGKNESGLTTGLSGNRNHARHDAYGTAGETSIPMNTD
ncbi:hypothetical protein FSP39_005408 [Pinctada imbricata]|uniref:Uncharacterized protein n=1 Tax=Pinctada imbricata TaxID=66713 RepID=A0AA88YMK2_PINIB|nr:hypothetical protein FSP39_005408 [Pinctada imbricata]